VQEILVVDDDAAIRDLLAAFLGGHGFCVTSAADGETGLDLLGRGSFDLALVDLVLPGMGGIDLIKEMRRRNLSTPVVVITGHGTIETAVEAMRLGVHDYVTKPFNLTDLHMTVGRVLDLVRLNRENAALRRQLRERFSFRRLVGTSAPMQALYRLIEKIADTDSTVLITGESGTGKDLVAKTIHFNSSRSAGPFVPVNCAAIPRDLIESELFGHERGAFTGAVSGRAGRFELAAGGTLFLDEIGELPPALQAKLLRVIQEKEFERVGGTKTLRVDVRIVAATNRDLERAVKEGTFREDLFYRLNVLPLHLPSLRERPDDIPLLAEFFVTEICRRKKKPPMKITPRARECLVAYRWPGNVRELENAIERMIILGENGTIDVEDLPPHIREAAVQGRDFSDAEGARPIVPALCWTPGGIDLDGLLEELERRLILKALEEAGGVKNRAAALLGLNRTTLIERMKKKGLMAPAGVSSLSPRSHTTQ